MMELTLYINGMMCANCSQKLEEKASKLAEIEEIHVNYASAKINVKFKQDSDKNTVFEKLNKLCTQIEPKAYLTDKEPVSLGLASSVPVSKKENDSCDCDEHNHSHDDDRSHSHSHGHSHSNAHADINVSHSLADHKKEMLIIGITIAIYAFGIIYKGSDMVKLAIFIIAYIIIGKDVLLSAFKNILRGEVFDENFLMSIATLGAFAIGEYPEAVAVMLFYNVGELFQDMAVNRSRKSIKALMNIKPDYANLKVDNNFKIVKPEAVNIGDIILVKPGEKVPLDGTLLSESTQMDTSNLTGESVPRIVNKGDTVLSGFINKTHAIEMKVEKTFGESTVNKILELVENASAKKAPTEKFITRFSRYYTPAVVFFALALAIIPPFFTGFNFSEWLYRALIFLVVSCPCALVVSIPLGFFGGIGAASKHGILIKGGNYLEALKNAEIAVFDKTGTLTEGIFKVQEITPAHGMNDKELLELAAYAESHSSHPIGVSILKAYNKPIDYDRIQSYENLPGYGVRAVIDGKKVLAGNEKLMQEEKIDYINDKFGTIVHLSVDGSYAGSISIYDKIKEDSKLAMQKLKSVGIHSIAMLTGDNEKTALDIAEKIGIDNVKYDLLPDQKVAAFEELMKMSSPKGKVIFTGDGINDAPVLARADIGIAMGSLGSDAAIESADVVIMTDEPSKIAEAIKIAKFTNKVVWQNIYFSLGIKGLVLILGAFGMANMWEAVFADVGVAVIAVLNATRISKI